MYSFDQHQSYELLADVEGAVANGCDLEWRRDHFMPGEVLTAVEEQLLLNEIKTRMPEQGLFIPIAVIGKVGFIKPRMRSGPLR